jgi:predicted methyltransferase
MTYTTGCTYIDYSYSKTTITNIFSNLISITGATYTMEYIDYEDIKIKKLKKKRLSKIDKIFKDEDIKKRRKK